MKIPLPYSQLVKNYQNTELCNDQYHEKLTDLTRADELLSSHRSHIEKNKLGFGDAAFHAMWEAIVVEAGARFSNPKALEIGVYKGQVISLWALLAKRHSIPLEISAITPLRGNPKPKSSLLRRIRYYFEPKFRELAKSGNFYDEADYHAIISKLFSDFGCDFSRVSVSNGFSTDADVLKEHADKTYDIVYIDGDHTYDGALADFRNFAPKVSVGGWLIADDAGFDLPGSTFWKGYESVTRAVNEVILKAGFLNVFNIGHNRVFERTE